MKKGGTYPKGDAERYSARLQEIAETVFGALSDDEALALLAERKALEAEREKMKREHSRIAELEKEKTEAEAAIAELNRSITPEKSDEALLGLIKERKESEAKLDGIERELLSMRREGAPKEEIPAEKEAADSSKAFQPVSAKNPISEDIAVQDTEEAQPPAPEVSAETVAPEESVSAAALAPDFGKESIVVDPLQESGELDRYLSEIREHTESLGMLLQGMPKTAKANRTLMLKVAEIDPAYAMHYAEDSLKRDESFCVKVAGMKNNRNSGNALAEMLPEVRTAQVVMAGVKQDYRNVRFALPNMEGYRDMLEIAKKGTIERVKELKDGADAALLVPKVLQKDAEFMQKVEALVSSPREGESAA